MAIDEKIDGNSDVVIKIEDNIKGKTKRDFINEILMQLMIKVFWYLFVFIKTIYKKKMVDFLVW